MRLNLSLIAAASLAACTQQPAERTPDAATSEAEASSAAGPAPAPTPATASASQVASLEGEWRVAGIDGGDFNEPYGLALSGSDRELWWEPRCAAIARSYRIDGARIAFGPAQGAPPPGGPTQAVCTIAPPPRIAEVLRAIDAATSVTRTANNGIEISGGGHSLLLFSQ